LVQYGCAGCGKPVTVGIVIAGVVIYHEFCWWRRTRILSRLKTDEGQDSVK
jgi:hypothetical protein